MWRLFFVYNCQILKIKKGCEFSQPLSTNNFDDELKKTPVEELLCLYLIKLLNQSLYILLIRSLYISFTTLLLTFKVGVKMPLATLHSSATSS